MATRQKCVHYFECSVVAPILADMSSDIMQAHNYLDFVIKRHVDEDGNIVNISKVDFENLLNTVNSLIDLEEDLVRFGDNLGFELVVEKVE